MSAFVTQVLGRVWGRAGAAEDGAGVRMAQGRFLDELPGFAFAIITLVWIFASFAGLAGIAWQPAATGLAAHVHQFTAQHASHAWKVLSRTGTVAGLAKRGWSLYVARNSG